MKTKQYRRQQVKSIVATDARGPIDKQVFALVAVAHDSVSASLDVESVAQFSKWASRWLRGRNHTSDDCFAVRVALEEAHREMDDFWHSQKKAKAKPKKKPKVKPNHTADNRLLFRALMHVAAAAQYLAESGAADRNLVRIKAMPIRPSTMSSRYIVADIWERRRNEAATNCKLSLAEARGLLRHLFPDAFATTAETETDEPEDYTCHND